MSASIRRLPGAALLAGHDDGHVSPDERRPDLGDGPDRSDVDGRAAGIARRCFQGLPASNSRHFWIAFHSVHELTFVAALGRVLVAPDGCTPVAAGCCSSFTSWCASGRSPTSRQRSSRFQSVTVSSSSRSLARAEGRAVAQPEHRPRPDLPGPEPRNTSRPSGRCTECSAAAICATARDRDP